MAIMTTVKLSAQIRSIKTNSTNLRAQIQEALISCAYYAVKDGNTNPFNQLLEAVGTGARVKGITMWAETWGFVRVKDGKFALNKSARDAVHVSNEEDFAHFETEMRAAPAWHEMAPKEKVVSMFDVEHYLQGVINKLDKEGAAAVVPYITEAIEKYNRDVQIAELAQADAVRREGEKEVQGETLAIAA